MEDKLKIHLKGGLYWQCKVKQPNQEIQLEQPKKALEALKELGVPVQEISFIKINNEKTDLEAIVKNGDTLEAIPVISGG